MAKIYQKSFPGGKNAGFTLIKLLVVVLIIGILAAIAVPQYQKAVLKSRYTQAVVLADAILKAQEVYRMANGAYAPGFGDLDITMPSKYTRWLYDGGNNIVEMSYSNKEGCYFREMRTGVSPAPYINCYIRPSNAEILYYRILLPSKKRRCICTEQPYVQQICQQLTGKSAPDGSHGDNMVYYEFPDAL